MLKTKYGLIIFKKIAFQLFYFGFVLALIYFFAEIQHPTTSIFKINYLFAEIFLMCLLLFYLNSIFFAKAMVVNKRYSSFLIKNIFLLTFLIFVPSFIEMGLNIKTLPISNTFLFFEFFIYLLTIAASLLYSDWMYQIENKGAMYRLLKEKNKFEIELLKSQFSPPFSFQHS